MINRLIATVAFIISFIITAFFVEAQEKWSLQECIDYAMENNIQIKKQIINSTYSKNQLKQSKNDRLPSLSGGLSNDYSFGRSLTIENTYKNINSISFNGYLSSQLLIWNGFRQKNTIALNKVNVDASLQDLEKVKSDVTLAVATHYLDILYAQEMIETSQLQIEITKKQIERTRNLVEAGSLAKGNLLEIESQLANEELQLVNNQNQLQLAYLGLYQLLEIPLDKKFTIESPSLPNITMLTADGADNVFQSAVAGRPEVMAAQYRVEAAQKQLKIAKSGYYPSLSLGANYNTNYNNKYTGLDGKEIAFGKQLDNNQRYGFGFNLSIPIFNKMKNRTNVANAELQILSKKLDLETTKNMLRKEIEQSYTNAVAAFNKYLASQKAVKSLEESFRYTEEKYNVGLISTWNYNQAKTNLNKAKSELLKSKYNYIFRTKILDFYKGVPISF